MELKKVQILSARLAMKTHAVFTMLEMVVNVSYRKYRSIMVFK